MSAEYPFGGGTFIADSSAWARASEPRVARDWALAVRTGLVATCPIVKLELLYSARDASSFDELDRLLRGLRDVPVTRSVTDAALAAMRELAGREPGFHRVKLPDVVVAACAQDAGLGVLHYHHHYDRLAEVMDFESRWITPAGSIR